MSLLLSSELYNGSNDSWHTHFNISSTYYSAEHITDVCGSWHYVEDKNHTLELDYL